MQLSSTNITCENGRELEQKYCAVLLAKLKLTTGSLSIPIARCHLGAECRSDFVFFRLREDRKRENSAAQLCRLPRASHGLERLAK